MNGKIISVKVISDLDALSGVEDAWNNFVRNHAESPFFLSSLARFIDNCNFSILFMNI